MLLNVDAIPWSNADDPRSRTPILFMRIAAFIDVRDFRGGYAQQLHHCCLSAMRLLGGGLGD